MNLHPLLKKYRLPNRTMFDRKDVVSICEQLDWTEKELARERAAAGQARKRSLAVRRRWQRSPPNPTVAAHRTKPTLALGAVMTTWPMVQWYLETEPSPVALAVLGCILLFVCGQYFIHLFFRSV